MPDLLFRSAWRLASLPTSGAGVDPPRSGTKNAAIAQRVEQDVLGHLSFGVADLERAATFYDGVLATLGYVRVWSDVDAVGYGKAGGNDKLALFARPGLASPPGAGFHLAFDAPSRAAVGAFHAAALRLGGRDEGAPGERPHYGPTYYAAFVTDPDGHKLEAVHQ